MTSRLPSDLPIILGMDPSTRAFGWAVLQNDEVLGYGEIRPKTNANRIERLTVIYNELESIIDRYRPTIASAEDTFAWRKNMDTAMRLSEVRGVAMLALGRHNIPLVLFKPTSIKLIMTGSGKAEKDDMIRAACQRFNLGLITSNMADAIAAALAYATHPSIGFKIA